MLIGIQGILPTGRVWLWLAVGLLAGVVSPGCGEKTDPKMGKVSGTVRFEGKALPSGRVSFVSNTNAMGAAPIAPDGSYTLSVPSGSYQVAIEAREGGDSMDAEGKPIRAKSLIPDKYSDIATSGLSATVDKGKTQKVDFDLKP